MALRQQALFAHQARPHRNRTAADVAFLERPTASIVSPLRYPGSKRRFASYIAHTLELNDLDPASLFVEAFAGGASVALQLLNDEKVEEIGLADADPLVASFWQTVFWDAEWLVRRVETMQVTLRQWHHFRRYVWTDRRDRAIACLFLNRTSYSGILAPDAGPIGGQAQTSNYSIDCRFPRETLVRRIRQAAALRDRVAFVWNCTWSETLARMKRMERHGTLPRRKTFLYFDPPFFEKADALYAHCFDDAEHRNFRDAVLRIGRPWLISYDAAPMAERLYGKRARHVKVEQLYSTSGWTGQKAQHEVIITNLDVVPSATRVWRRSEDW
ncbi:MAG: DNA adenine methylase [Chloroflexota bacterium]